LELVAEAVKLSGLATLVVGRGSNMLVADRGFRGVAILLDTVGFAWVDIDGLRVSGGAAVALPALARRSVEAGLAGLEWAVGVPGSLGGAVRMNAGGHGSEISHNLGSASVFDLDAPPESRTTEMTGEQLGLAYRGSNLDDSQVVISASFDLRAGDSDSGRSKIAEIVRWRRENQPGGQNAGSVFKNPPGDSAGRLIDLAGLKGLRVGTAAVSDKHANFIQADDGGSADDVAALIALVQRRVRDRFSIELHPEVKMVGFSTGGSP
jgi:UDP-N-acetylmuramate dehydrogenase